jgi:hypothetical protein
VDIVIKVPSPAVAHVGAFGLHRYANEFLGAAMRFEPQDAGFTPVPYYLVCRSIELSLKSYLVARGLKRNDLKQIGHNLNKALHAASDHGLKAFVDVSPEETLLIAQANDLYSQKQFEYFENLGLAFGFTNPPDLGGLSALASKLVTNLELTALRAVNGQIGEDGSMVT